MVTGRVCGGGNGYRLGVGTWGVRGVMGVGVVADAGRRDELHGCWLERELPVKVCRECGIAGVHVSVPFLLVGSRVAHGTPRRSRDPGPLMGQLHIASLQILDEVEKRRQICMAVIYPFMQGLREAAFPAPGKTVCVKSFIPGSGTEVSLQELRARAG